MIRRLRSLGRHNVMLAAVSTLATSAVLFGAGSAWGYWATGSTASATVSSATLTITATNFTSIGTTFYNDNLTPAQTGSVTVTNTTTTASTQALPVTVSFPANSGTLAGVVTATVWPTTSAANCTATATVGTGSQSALWSAGITMASVTLATGSSAIYCVRSTATSTQALATSSGSQTFTPSVSATETAGSAGVYTATAMATATIGTTAIYPATTVPTISWWLVHPVSSSSSCMDDTSFGVTSGTADISYGCKYDTTDGNQQWSFVAGSGGYYQIENRNANALRVDSNGTVSGANTTLNTSSTATTQLWQPQLVSGTSAQATAGTATYQFVNQASGYCLSVGSQDANTGLVNMMQSRCTGASNQQFTLTLAKLEGFACTTSSTTLLLTTTYTAQYSWSNTYNAANNGPYSFTTTVSGTSRTFASAANNSNSITVTGNETGTGIYSLNNAPAATYTVTVTDAQGSVVATTTIVEAKGTSGLNTYAGVKCS